MTQYDKIVEGYEKATLRPLRKYAYNPTIEHYLGDLSNKRVLDLACGEGISTRLIKKIGAKEVFGIDISCEQIKKARLKDKESQYFIADAISDDFSIFGKFDIITAMMLTTYIPTENSLNNFLSNVSRTLVKGGMFYAMVPDFNALKNGSDSYGIKIEKNGIGNSRTLSLSDFEGNLFCQPQIYYLPQKTYKKLLKNNGFICKWNSGIVSQEGILEYGNDFWKEYFKNPVYNMIEAKRI